MGKNFCKKALSLGGATPLAIFTRQRDGVWASVKSADLQIRYETAEL
jgi:hypothetical protein